MTHVFEMRPILWLCLAAMRPADPLAETGEGGSDAGTDETGEGAGRIDENGEPRAR